MKRPLHPHETRREWEARQDDEASGLAVLWALLLGVAVLLVGLGLLVWRVVQ